VYHSPLRAIAFLRIIIDEGHEFSSATSNAVIVAQEIVTAERRWIVSGTPARDRLYGIEVDTAADADVIDMPSASAADGPVQGSSSSTPPSTSQSLGASSVSTAARHAALERRRRFDVNEEIGTSSAARSIGTLTSCFLQTRPWATNSRPRRVEWDDFIYRHTEYRRRTHDSFALCFRKTLESLVIKTQPDDVERDIILPPLSHKVVRLDPSFYDKLTFNLFILVLTTNAVASERTDVDYLFHKNSAKARNSLITNLRQGTFFWTGFSEKDVLSAMKEGKEYLEKENTRCTLQDRTMLTACIKYAEVILASSPWHGMSKYHELGLFVNEWLGDAAERDAWALSKDSNPLLLGVSQLIKAQELINKQLFDQDPLQGFDAAGAAAMATLAEEERAEEILKNRKAHSAEHKLLKGVPSSGISGQVSKSKQHSNISPKKPKTEGSALPLQPGPNGRLGNSSGNSSRKRKREELEEQQKKLDGRDVPGDSPLVKPRIIGTVSAKLSYLLSRVLALYQAEKILIFYDGENTAFYLAQCFDLLHIKHLIYAKSLSNELKSKYVVTFDLDVSIRVLLMDIRCGAFGLNVNKASRVFFINPVCRPSTEAQAIKRAHRIGQMKHVHVETLILKGTMEEAIFERSQKMTQTEHLEASQLSDDQGIAHIIQNAEPMPISVEEGHGVSQMAPLMESVQIFGRKGRGDTLITGIDDLDDGDSDELPAQKKQTDRNPRYYWSHLAPVFSLGLEWTPIRNGRTGTMLVPQHDPRAIMAGDNPVVMGSFFR
jgi:hypothetical protein